MKNNNEIITIQISKYLTNELAEKIAVAQWGSDAPDWVNRVKMSIFEETMCGNDCFGVVAENSKNALIGRLHCMQNRKDPISWCYADLFVIPKYRRLGIATRMISLAMRHLSEIGAETFRCYVDPQNNASIALQRSLSFEEMPYEVFNDLITDGEMMFEYRLCSNLSINTATVDDAYFCAELLDQNKEALHTNAINPVVWKELLSVSNPNEKHLLICMGAMPVGYMKLIGLEGKDIANISALFVSSAYQRRGIGTFAVKFAEKYLLQRGFQRARARVAFDNTPPRNLFKKLGYSENCEDSSTVCFSITL